MHKTNHLVGITIILGSWDYIEVISQHLIYIGIEQLIGGTGLSTIHTIGDGIVGIHLDIIDLVGIVGDGIIGTITLIDGIIDLIIL